MSTSERQTDPPAAKPIWHLLRDLILLMMGLATIFLTVRTSGGEALETVLVFSTLVGIGFVVVTQRWLRRFSLVVFGVAMIGGIAGVELAVYGGSVSVNRLHDSGVPTLNTEINTAFRILGTHATLGAFVGGILGVMLGGWLRAKFGSQVDESERRWYLPSRGALLGLLGLLLLLGSCSIWNAHAERRYNERAKAAEAIGNIGGKVNWRCKGGAEEDAYEIDMRESPLTDAAMGYILILNPQRLLLGTRATDQGVKKLRQTLPNCKIEWTPPTKDERQSPAARDQLR